MKKTAFALAGSLIAFVLAEPSMAAAIAVDDFTTITDGVVDDLPNATVTGTSFGGRVMTGTPPNTTVAGSGSATAGPPSAPGDGLGWALNAIFPNEDSVTLDFDLPVTAFGITVILGSGANPATLEAFDALGASLGTATSGPGSAGGVRAFVGLWSDALEITSVTLSTVFTTPTTVHADLYALSLTPNQPTAAPEPAAISLFGMGILALGLVRRRRPR